MFYKNIFYPSIIDVDPKTESDVSCTNLVKKMRKISDYNRNVRTWEKSHMTVKFGIFLFVVLFVILRSSDVKINEHIYFLCKIIILLYLSIYFFTIFMNHSLSKRIERNEIEILQKMDKYCLQ